MDFDSSNSLFPVVRSTESGQHEIMAGGEPVSKEQNHTDIAHYTRCIPKNVQSVCLCLETSFSKSATELNLQSTFTKQDVIVKCSMTLCNQMKEKFHGGLTSFNDFDLLLALKSALILNEFFFLPFLKDFKTRVKVMDRQRENKDICTEGPNRNRISPSKTHRVYILFI